MIISYQKQFLFLHVPKTGGLSVGAALHAFEHTPDQYVINRLLARAGIGVNHYLFGYRQRMFRRHSPALLVRRRLPGRVYDRLFKFAFVRNPWDLLVSYRRFVLDRPKHHRYRRMAKMGFREYLRFARDKGIGLQKTFLSDRRGHLLVDFVGRFENIQRDFAEVLDYLGIDATLPHLNRSQHDGYRQYYDRQSRNYVKHAYGDDIDQFGYTF